MEMLLWPPAPGEPHQDRLTTCSHRAERCTLDERTLATLGINVGRQVRITRTRAPSLYAVYTVTAEHAGTSPPLARAGPEGVGRLVLPMGCLLELLPFLDGKNPSVAVSTGVVSTISAAAAEAAREFIEESSGSGQGLAVLAPHGGMIEPHTDAQAATVELELADKPVRR
jgi:hypothetical protein